MDYQKEYASLVGQIDRAISILEHYEPGDPIIQKAGDLLLSALREAEEHYLQDTPRVEAWRGLKPLPFLSRKKRGKDA